MLPQVLLPETVVHEDGIGRVLELDSNSSPRLLILNITRILEQESLELTVSGSPDGQHWLPLLTFPRKSYCGTYSLYLDPAAHPGVRYLRAEWTLSRWGPAEEGVLCAFNLSASPTRVLHAGA